MQRFIRDEGVSVVHIYVITVIEVFETPMQEGKRENISVMRMPYKSWLYRWNVLAEVITVCWRVWNIFQAKSQMIYLLVLSLEGLCLHWV